MNIFIRADGGNSIGLGHVMRMLVLAKELSKSSQVLFLCKNSISNVEKFRSGIEVIKKNKFNVIEISEKNVVEDIIRAQQKYKAKLIITDSYEVDEEYFNTLKVYFQCTGYIDDINKIKMNVDFIINQNFNAEYMDYSKTTNLDTKLLLGSKYCMLREEFRRGNSQCKRTKENVENILFTLGGMDNEHNTLKILRQIEICEKNIHVVIGAAFDKTLNLELLSMSKKNSKIKLHKNPSMSELMNKCDIAISACGSTLYELCAMRIPTIGIVIADNQEGLGKQMIEKGAILGGKWINQYAYGEINELLYELITKKEIRSNIINKQSELINIDGVFLLTNEIEKILIEAVKK